VTRLDRARIALAYEYLRYRSRFDGDRTWRAVSHSEAWGSVDKSAGALPYLLRKMVAAELYVGDARILRARLALYLRALIRAYATDEWGDADLGPRRPAVDVTGVCADCGWRTGDPEPDPPCKGGPSTRRIRPLWESAPAHRVAT